MTAEPSVPTTTDDLRVEQDGPVLVVTLARPAKRNALSDAMVLRLQAIFDAIPSAQEPVRAVVIAAEGDHFCAGLDLASLGEKDTFEGILHSRMWHRAFEAIESGPVPVICALQGAVVGGGLELAAATHVRVAEPSTFFALPEGSRGLFVGGGGSVRVPRLVGTHRMADMMLTGRVYEAADGVAAGFAQYLVGEGEAKAEALRLAHRVAQNAPASNFAVVQALPRIAEVGPTEGLLMESLMAAIAQGTPDAKARMAAFLEGRANKVKEA
ncbi:crotonase/enoyl-CoA hydratase family protein [Arsenicicoccus piscis]|nr:crotonase/enoyl-CoA hydratase family protein [Arsenicicoccus piscis]MCH8627626.1 crotonase/enoyl-CoA hydratase family protein [Arsenicicoccus piscis]